MPPVEKQRTPCSWVILTFGGDRQYGGNSGYEDETSEYYSYDSFVANHRRVSTGDVAIVCDKRFVVGASRIDHIGAAAGVKRLQRCPICRTTGIKERKSRQPRFRCNEGHEFDSPLPESADCTLYTAHFEQPFLLSPKGISRPLLRPGCPKYSDQNAMQLFEFRLVSESLARQAPDLYTLLDRVHRIEPTELDQGNGGVSEVTVTQTVDFGVDYQAADEDCTRRDVDLFEVDQEVVERGLRGHAVTQICLPDICGRPALFPCHRARMILTST